LKFEVPDPALVPVLSLLSPFVLLRNFADCAEIRKFADQADDINLADCSAREFAAGELPVGGGGR